MTPRTRIELRMSQTKARLGELVEMEERTADQEAEFEKLRSSLQADQVNLTAALELQADDERRPEKREAKSLEERAHAEPWLVNLINDERVTDGPVAEFSQEMGLKDTEVDIRTILPKAYLETRADTPSSLPSDAISQMPRPIAGFVYPAQNVGSALGLMPEIVPASQANYPILSTGASVASYAKDATAESTAASFAVTRLTPIRTQTRITFRLEDQSIFPQMEAALRMDMSMALSDSMDSQLLTGNATAGNVNGLLRITEPDVPSAVSTFSDFQALLSSQLDGRYAPGMSSIRLLLGVQSAMLAIGTYKASESDLSSWDWLMQRSGMTTISTHVPAPRTTGASAGVQAVIGTKSNGLSGSYAFPVWRNASFVVDRLTDLSKGWVTLNLITLWNFQATRRNNSFFRASLKLS